ncbi:DegT/DnrJ/EryC1/StrS aminotransferase family protein [compost metagenome]
MLLFENHKDFYIQKDIDNSSWFGFSLIIKPESTLDRAEIVKKLEANQIDCRPIVTGDFTKNEVLKHFEYEIFGKMKNAQYLDKKGFFVGNHQVDLTEEIKHLYRVLSNPS